MANELRETFQDIADAIRGKTGGTDKMAPSDMAAQIGGITAGGGCDHTVIEGAEVELYLADGDQTVNLPDGVVAKSAVIKKPATLTPENIVQGVEIAGVEGSHQDPEVIVGAEVPLYMADGDMVVEMPEGYVVQSAIIKKPETLIPENIAKDVNIAGVIGTHEGGGGGSVEGYATVTFMNGGEVLFSRMVLKGDDCPDPWVQKRIETPTKESTVQYNYTFNGWATADGGSADSNTLKGITEDKTLYAAFAESVRMYTVNFYDGDTLLHTEQVPYGGSSEYVYQKSGHAFNGWTPAPTNITGDMSCYGEWVESNEITDSWDEIVAAVNDGTYASKYHVGQYKPLDLGDEGIVNMQIVAFDTDTSPSGGTIATSWIAKELLATKRQMSPGSGEVEFRGSTLYSWLNGDLRDRMPTSVRSAIKAARKGYVYVSGFSQSTNTSDCHVWVPSTKEVNVAIWAIEKEESSPVYSAVYVDAETTKKCINGTSTPTNWWTRNRNSSTGWMYVNSSGTKSMGQDQTGSIGVCIGFCI